MASFSVGDVVRLRGGGPKMTVEGWVEEPAGSKVLAVWFDVDRSLNREAFWPGQLELVAESVGG